MQKSTDFSRRIIGQRQGGVSLSCVCPHCHRHPRGECIWWVSMKHRKKSVTGGARQSLGRTGLRGPLRGEMFGVVQGFRVVQGFGMVQGQSLIFRVLDLVSVVCVLWLIDGISQFHSRGHISTLSATRWSCRENQTCQTSRKAFLGVREICNFACDRSSKFVVCPGLLSRFVE